MCRTADVADLAGANEIVERAERFFKRDIRVLAVGEVDIDIIGLKALEAIFTCFYQACS